MRINKDSDSVLIQTTVSKPLQRWLQVNAKREGLSLAAFVRRMLLASHAQRQPLRPDVRVQVLPDNIFPKRKAPAAGKKFKTKKKAGNVKPKKKAAKKVPAKRKVSKKQTELAL